MVHSKTCVTRRSALASARRCCPTWPGSVTSSSASRARSTASAAIASNLGRAVRRRVVVVGDVISGLEIVGDGAHHGGDLLRVRSEERRVGKERGSGGEAEGGDESRGYKRRYAGVQDGIDE